MNDISAESKQSLPQVSRRQFVAIAAGCAAACACGGLAVAATSDKPIDVGPIADYGKDGISDKFARQHSIFVIREDGKIYASSALCTHKNALLKVRGNELYCPKHGSVFANDGTVDKGPADSSLERFAIAKDADGHLIVDPSKSFREKRWSDPASFIKI